MGQKTHPIGFRIGVIRDWNSKWFANKRDYTQLLHEDIRIKDYIKKRYASAGISKVVVERMADTFQGPFDKALALRLILLPLPYQPSFPLQPLIYQR